MTYVLHLWTAIAAIYYATNTIIDRKERTSHAIRAAVWAVCFVLNAAVLYAL